MVTKLVAEIGCNHCGDVRIAKQLITAAAVFARADVVKFQKRNPRELLSFGEYNRPHPNPEHAYGATYGEHREFLEFSAKTHRELSEFCDDMGIEYACSVWDNTSASEIAEINPSYIKIPSPKNADMGLIGWLIDNYDGKIHVSLGMTTRSEEERLIECFEKAGRLRDLTIYACTSAYPVAFSDICLLEIRRLVDTYGGMVDAIGFSGHHNGIAVDIAAATLGASVIERHFTLDRTWKGTDHAASLEPDGLRKLKRDLDNTALALTYKPAELLECEMPSYKKLKGGGNV